MVLDMETPIHSKYNYTITTVMVDECVHLDFLEFL